MDRLFSSSTRIPGWRGKYSLRSILTKRNCTENHLTFCDQIFIIFL